MPDLTEILGEAAEDPASFTSDGQTAVSRPLPDLIELDRHQAAKDALAGPNPNGGSKSLWGKTRMARGITKGPSPQ